MKKYSIRLLAPVLLLFSVFLSSFSVEEPKTAEPERLEIQSPEAIKYYWFFIRIRIDERLKKIHVLGTASRVTAGTLETYRRKLWWGIAHMQLAVGPFMSEEEAANARLHYRSSRTRIMKAETAPEHEVHWFLLSVKELKRARAYKLMPMPARTASGTMDEFIDALYEGMAFEHLAIGPFYSYDQAELSKYIYRENE